jgi:DNA polymerase elongation subunit (family B)
MYQNLAILDDPSGGPTIVFVFDDERGLLQYPYSKFRYAYVENEMGKYISIYGKRLRRIKRYRKDRPGLYESDVPRETRVLTDLYLDNDLPSTNHRMLILDIEVSSIGGFATPQKANKEITAIANYDATNTHYTVFILDTNGRIPSVSEQDRTIVSCPTELELLTKWLEYYKTLSPTIITGWNCDGYDIPYLHNRLIQVFDDPEMPYILSPLAGQTSLPLVRYNENRRKYQIAGVSVLDYMKIYKKYTYIEQPSYRLDAIGKFEVGLGKIEYEGTLDDLYKRDLHKFIEYNVNDVRIVAAIDEKMKMIELIRFICHTGHVPYEDFAYFSRFIEGTILTYLHRKHIICPNKPEGGRKKFDELKASGKEGITGAYVKDPVPGLYEWVYSLDLQSLYPSIIMSLNISPETKIGKILNWNVEQHLRNEMQHYEIADTVGVQRLSRKEFMAMMETFKFMISSAGVLYDSKKPGIIPEILDKWFADRLAFKSKMKELKKTGKEEEADFYDRRQHVQKILLNSIYGCLALPIFRFYDVDNGESVTKTGQDVIKTTAKILQRQMGNITNEIKNDYCIYIDTDSVYFSAYPIIQCIAPAKYGKNELPDYKTETIEIATKFEQIANSNYNSMAKKMFFCDKHRFYIKGESVMETVIWIAKKRYAMKKVYDLESGIDVNKVGYKGLDIVRSTFPPAFKTVMERIFEQILSKASKPEVDATILEFKARLDTLDYLTVARNIAVKNIAKYEDGNEQTLTIYKKGTPIHVKAAIAYNRLLKYFGQNAANEPIRNGQKIKYVLLKDNPYELESVAIKTYDDPPEIIELVRNYIDYSALFEKELASKITPIYNAMGWGFLPTEINQTVDEYFSFS